MGSIISPEGAVTAGVSVLLFVIGCGGIVGAVWGVQRGVEDTMAFNNCSWQRILDTLKGEPETYRYSFIPPVKPSASRRLGLLYELVMDVCGWGIGGAFLGMVIGAALGMILGVGVGTFAFILFVL